MKIEMVDSLNENKSKCYIFYKYKKIQADKYLISEILKSFLNWQGLVKLIKSDSNFTKKYILNRFQINFLFI